MFLKGTEVPSFPLQVKQDSVTEENTNMSCWLGFVLVFFLFFPMCLDFCASQTKAFPP